MKRKKIDLYVCVYVSLQFEGGASTSKEHTSDKDEKSSQITVTLSDKWVHFPI